MLTRLQFCPGSPNPNDELEPSFFHRPTYEFTLVGSLGAEPAHSFSTLFGSFTIHPWRQHTNVRRVGVRVLSQSASAVTIFLTRDDGRTERLPSEYDNEHDVYWCDISGDVCGILYPVIASATEPPSIEYVTDATPLRPVRLAVIIPTFRREVQVVRNARAIALASRIQHEYVIRTFVIDNGNTLSQEMFADSDNVSLIYNRNLGGAGGFARGMIEVCDGSQSFTHIVMADDDAKIVPESIIRSAAFFSFCNENIYLGGTMLIEHDREVVHESGAQVTGPYGFHSCKQGLNVSSPVDLARLCNDDLVDYFGWYLVGYPVAAISDLGLPQPFFIRFDDQEFGLRLLTRGYRSATLLGFCVWHEAFHLRDSQLTHYYLARNGIITLFLHRPTYSSARYVKQLTKVFVNALYTLRYDRASFILDGIVDALKGPQFLASVDEEALNKSLLLRQTEKIRDCSPDSLNQRWFHVKHFRHRSFRRFVVNATLGGHLLLGHFARRNTHHYLNSVDPRELVFSRRAFFFEPISGVGWIASRNRRRFFKLLVRGVGVMLRLLLQAKRVGRDFRGAESQLVGFELWRQRLSLPADK